MNSSAGKSEKFLYEIWKKKSFEKGLETYDGDAIAILDTGEENTDLSGPDFKNARVRIGNLIYIGDIEIDSDVSDWRSHGHNIDKNYTKVILHLALNNKQAQHYVVNKTGRKIPTICLSNFINSNLLENNVVVTDDENIRYLKCHNKNLSLDKQFKIDFLYELGLVRFQRKCDRLYHRLKELTYLDELRIKEPVISYDLNEKFLEKKFTFENFRKKEVWQQLFYEQMFEALGYSKNKNAMLKLAQFAKVDFLKSVCKTGDNYISIQSCLFSISGLLPAKDEIPEGETCDYINLLHDNWFLINEKYDGKTLDSSVWNFFKLRPQNFPTIRIAGGSILLYRIIFENFLETMFNKFEQIFKDEVLVRIIKDHFIIKAKGYWKTHYVFNKPANYELKYLIGVSRCNDIVVNVLFPFISIYAEIFGKKEVAKKVLRLFSNYTQRDDNNTVELIANSLDVDDAWHRSILAQGMIEIYRNYCTKNRCLECKIGQAVFE